MPAAVNQAVLVISDLCWARGNATGGPYRAGKSSRSGVKLMSVLDLGETQFTQGAASGPGPPVGIHKTEAGGRQLCSRIAGSCSVGVWRWEVRVSTDS